jgi:ATP dependent DNA ligase domain
MDIACRSTCATNGCVSTRSTVRDWSKRHPLIVEAARKIDGSAILDAEVVWLDSDGAANFDALHSRVNDQNAVALAFDLMSLDGEDFRQEPYSERKAVLRKILRRTRRGIQYVEHAEDHGDRLFEAVCELGAVENLDQGQKSEVAGCYSCCRWHVLIVSSDAESCVGPQTHTDCKID